MTPRELVLGIDFGTTYTSAGVLIDDRVEFVLDDGDNVIPSVVYLPERGAPIVGRKALMRVMADPAGTIQSVKRILGRQFDHPSVRIADASSACLLERGDEGRVQLRVHQTAYACEQIVAYLLARLRDLAERRFGGRISRAVVTAPATAGPEYLAAMRRAARIAHLEIIEFLAEPVAGALALGLHGEPTQRHLLVCDFGGGTFDATLMHQDQLQFRALAVDGDSFLGGDDLDQTMCDAVAGAVYRRSSFDMLRETTRRQALLYRCESVKRQLSTQLEATLGMKDAYIERGENRDIDVKIERTWIEPRWAPLFQRSLVVVERMLATAGWGPNDLDEIILIGGTALVPGYQNAMKSAFPSVEISTSSIANLAVGIGAVLQTGRHVLASRRVPVLSNPPELKTA